jgi:hypothetical protein
MFFASHDVYRDSLSIQVETIRVAPREPLNLGFNHSGKAFMPAIVAKFGILSTVIGHVFLNHEGAV